MIEESYVSFDTAKMLKEAGFDLSCRGVYVTDRTGYYEFREYDNKQTTDDLCWNTEDGFQYEYLAPTQALAARWLREVHNIHVFAFFDYVERNWIYCIANLDAVTAEGGMEMSESNYPTYGEAMEDALQEAIKLIKK